MNYQEFIEYNRTRDQGQYTHRHHIIPVSDGGLDTPENLIQLSWLTHWYAHYLLAKENPDNKELQRAFERMGNIDQWLNRCYKWSQSPSEDLRSRMKIFNGGENNGMYGKHHSEETKRKMSESKKGKPSKLKGTHKSAEVIEKMSQSHLGKTPWNKNIPMSNEQKQKISAANKGKHWKLVDGRRVYYDTNKQETV